MMTWCRNANSIALNKSNYGSRYCIIKFDDLVLETESTMRFLAQWLGISFDSMLTTPTFNTAPVQANSSFPVATTGIIAETTGRQNMLAKTERDYIESVAMPLYRRLANLTALQSPLASAIVACFAAC